MFIIESPLNKISPLNCSCIVLCEFGCFPNESPLKKDLVTSGSVSAVGCTALLYSVGGNWEVHRI